MDGDCLLRITAGKPPNEQIAERGETQFHQAHVSCSSRNWRGRLFCRNVRFDAWVVVFFTANRENSVFF